LQLPDLAGKIERMSVFDVTSTRAAPELVGSDSNQSEEATRFESLSDLEEDLDRLLKLEDEGGLGDKGATACWEAVVLINHSQPDDHPESFLDSHIGLTITSTPQGQFVYWKGLEPSELLE
jgi:hypothetical protein